MPNPPPCLLLRPFRSHTGLLAGFTAECGACGYAGTPVSFVRPAPPWRHACPACSSLLAETDQRGYPVRYATAETHRVDAALDPTLGVFVCRRCSARARFAAGRRLAARR